MKLTGLFTLIEFKKKPTPVSLDGVHRNELFFSYKTDKKTSFHVVIVARLLCIKIPPILAVVSCFEL